MLYITWETKSRSIYHNLEIYIKHWLTHMVSRQLDLESAISRYHFTRLMHMWHSPQGPASTPLWVREFKNLSQYRKVIELSEAISL